MSEASPRAAGIFVTGTDTGVGKTFLSAALAAGSIAEGYTVRVRKPLLSGLDEPVGDGPPPDHELLASVTDDEPAERISEFLFGPSIAPHLAASEAGVDVDPDLLIERIASAAAQADRLIVEGAGGLLVPIRDGFGFRDLAVALGLPIVIAARPGLGTINHSLLTIEAARSVGLDVRAVVFGPWPEEPSAMELDNRVMVEQLSGVPVATLPWIDHRDRGAFAAAGSALPLDSIFSS